MKNKGGNIGIAIISAIFLFIVGMSIINILLPEVSTFRIEMDCSNTDDISSGNKLLCLVGDLSIPIWIMLILSISVGGIVAELTSK